jgi:hypothetical protein
MPSIPIDVDLYELAKSIVFKQYEKPSAYRSGAIVKLYKKLGGRYEDTKKGSRKSIDNYPLKRWYSERWEDVNPNKTKSSYPVYRPTVRITKQTPKTVQEISKKKLQEQANLKQSYKGKKNLPKF